MLEKIKALNMLSENINPTIIYNEGWIVRLLVIESMLEKITIENIEFGKLANKKRSSEALIASPFVTTKINREGYTHADIYKEKYVDLSRELKGNNTPSLSQVREAIIKIRTRKLPDVKTYPNAGSFFKNPILTKEEKEALQKRLVDAPIYNTGETSFKTSAAFLIEKAGYKGKNNGLVGTYENHALVIVNLGTDDGRDILNFANEITNEVEKQFGVRLEPEVWIY
jgi:UDP-N-acetylenolpyruvoylglucosamine reductase